MLLRLATLPGGLTAGVAFWGTCFPFVVAPYERLEPLLALPGQNVTTVEAAIAAATTAWLVAFLTAGGPLAWRTPLTWPVAVWLGASAIAALAAPVFYVSAVKVVARLAIGFVVVLLAANGVTTVTPVDHRHAVRGRERGGRGALRLDYAGVPAVLGWLRLFTTVSGSLAGRCRAGARFSHPTIASIYLEIAFALAPRQLPAGVRSTGAFRCRAALCRRPAHRRGHRRDFTRAD
jgi:hypothetical protein